MNIAVNFSYNINDNEYSPASALIGLYLNSYGTPEKELLSMLANQDRNIKYNLTVFCIKWFTEFMAHTEWDRRNEASHETAMKMAVSCCFIGVEFRYNDSKRFAKRETIEVNLEETESMTDFIVMMIRKISNRSYDPVLFFAQSRNQHRTCQQFMSRFCRNWFALMMNEAHAHSEHKELAARAFRFCGNYPMI